MIYCTKNKERGKVIPLPLIVHALRTNSLKLIIEA